jgi:multidrug efflux pump subunit AcrB
MIFIEVDPDYELDDVLDDTKTAIDSVDDLPDDAEVPVVTSFNNKDNGIYKIALTGESYEFKRKVAKKLRDVLEEDNRVSAINFGGYRKDDIRIEVDPDKINALELTGGEVANAIRDRNLNLSAGKFETKGGDIIIRTVAEFRNLEEIENVVVRSNNSGQKVTVKDVATVTRKPIKGSIIQRSQRQEAIFLEVFTKEKADILDSADDLKIVVKDFFANKGVVGNVKYQFSDDASFWVRRRLNVLTSNGMLGMVLVVSCLLFFLNFRTSIITALGAPIAFLVSFAIMDGMGVSLNMISMFALILVLGMLVDDSIIVAEHFYQKLEAGMKPKRAAREAAMETIAPVTATILTTMVAFGSLFFMGGIMGKFLWSVPMVVIICLIASWLECFFILPSHLNEFCRLSPKKKDKKPWYSGLMNVYGASLKKALSIPFIVQILFFVAFIGTIMMAKTMRFELFPGDDVRMVFVQMKAPVGTTLEVSDEAATKLEEIAFASLKKEEFEQVRTMVGMQVGDHGNRTGPHYASLLLYLTDPGERERTTDEILNSIVKQGEKVIKTHNIVVKKQEGGPPKGKPVQIDLKADSLEELKVVAKKVDQALAQIPGVTSTEIDFEDGNTQIVIDVNDAEARRLGLSTRQVALEMRRAFSGDALTEIRESDEDIEIKILLNEESRADKESLKKLYMLNSQGRRIPLHNLVTFSEQPGAFVIRRLDRKRTISVSGSLDKAVTTPVAVAQAIKEPLKEVMKGHPDVSYILGGENKDTKESMLRLAKSGIIAMLSIFMILVVMFSSLGQPFVVMSAIPLGLIGVVIAFKVFDQALGFMALMGVVGLVGVVVNDSIVLVNFINKTRKEVSDLKQAIVEASVSRFRPVLLTTVTTVAGLLPVAHVEGGDPFIKPMALSFAWGLLFASLVTLIFIPCTYYMYVRTLDFFQSLWGKVTKKRPQLEQV